ncbi:hypothetical protein GCM10009801_71400 [Streptomyces albiaxialis]|uniref:PTS fructose transporter subunit IIC n=1 Tax=Streptomyces albiaxialis TaxID=329523 RepID=A0ABP5IFH7_9ACTN
MSAAPQTSAGESREEGTGGARIVAVTACPTGIAHTYMAAEALEQAAAEAGVRIAVETQGSAGAEPVADEVIAAADAVIFAADVEVRDKDRFAGKPTVQVGVKNAISDGAGLIARAVAAIGTERHEEARTEREPAPAAEPPQGEGRGAQLRGWLMTGVSYMIPFVAAGGILIALGFALGGYEIDKAAAVTEHFDWTELKSWAALCFQTGQLAFEYLVPVLSGYIAFAMADRPGLAPGIVGGAVAVAVEAGFLGGLAAGLMAGGLVLWLRKLKIPAALRAIMPVVVIPLLGSLVVGGLMFTVVGRPIAWAQEGLTDWLNSLSGGNALLLGAVMGILSAFDMGGPVNKVAYTFGVAGLTTGTDGAFKVMGAVIAINVVPPLALALATTVRKSLFSRAEQQNGKAAWVLGFSQITEGALPFVALDPLRVIPACMAGCATTGMMTMAIGTPLRAPHGGLFVTPLVGSPFLWLLSIAVGVAVAALLVIVLKSTTRRRAAVQDA